MDNIAGEPMKFEWEDLPRIHHIAALQQSPRVTVEIKPENFTGRIILMSMFNDISWGSKDNKIECESIAQLFSLFARRFGAGRWSFLGLGSEKKCYSISEDSPQGEWGQKCRANDVDFRRKRTSSLPCHESIS